MIGFPPIVENWNFLFPERGTQKPSILSIFLLFLDDWMMTLTQFYSYSYYQADLKKELKSSKKFRDQIKNWSADTAIKDKTSLNEYKRKIEIDMERFKMVERQSKTKAFSKHGLEKMENETPEQKRRERRRSGCPRWWRSCRISRTRSRRRLRCCS